VPFEWLRIASCILQGQRWHEWKEFENRGVGSKGFEEAVFSLRIKRDHQEEWHHITSPSLALATRSAPDFGSHRCCKTQAAQ